MRANAVVIQEKPYVAMPPLPAIPDKNSRLDRAMETARAFGCKVTRVNSNDLAISHPLLNLQSRRPGISVSLSRKDVPQAFTSFLRRVRDATMRHPQYIKALKQEKAKPMFQAPALMNGLDSTRTQPEPKVSPLSPPPATPAPPGPPKEAATEPLGALQKLYDHKDRIGLIVGGVFAHLHYNDSQAEREPGDAIVAFAKAKTELRFQFDEAMACVNAIWNQLVSREHKIRELERDLDIATAPPAPEERGTPLAPKVAYRVDSTAASRQDKIQAIIADLLDEIDPEWGSSSGSLTRLGDAFRILAKDRSWPEAMIADFHSLNLEQYGWAIRRLKRPGGKRCLVGAQTWDEFIKCLGVIEADWKADHDG